MLLLVASAVAPIDLPTKAHVQATASARIERAAVANRQEWQRSAKRPHREIIVREEDGTPVLVRVIDYE